MVHTSTKLNTQAVTRCGLWPAELLPTWYLMGLDQARVAQALQSH